MPPARKGGLGRGLAALIPGDPQGSRLEEIPVSDIRPNRVQPRSVFDDDAIEALAASVRAVGVLQPILVRSSGSSYELIAGERRWRAARIAGLATVPALIRQADDGRALEHALVENLHREDLNPLEEAAAYQQLIEDFGLTHEDVAGRVGKTRSAITNMIRLLSLPPLVHGLLANAEITAGHARALLALPSRQDIENAAEHVASSGLSVRATEDFVARRLRAAEGERSNPRPMSNREATALLEVEHSLADYLNTRVRVQSGERKGKIVIDYASMDDLGRLWRLIVGTR